MAAISLISLQQLECGVLCPVQAFLETAGCDWPICRYFQPVNQSGIIVSQIGRTWFGLSFFVAQIALEH